MAFIPEEELHLFGEPRPLNALSANFIDEYHKRPYLRGLTEAELDARLNDILSSLMILGTDRKYRTQFDVRADGIYAPVSGLDYLRMAVEVWEERRLRNAWEQREHDRSGLALAERFADESWCWRPQWQEVSCLSRDAYEQPRMLFRFNSSIERNRSFLERGRFYVQPASVYCDALLDNARRDDELSTRWIDERLESHSYSVPDYYCMCFSSTYDYRLFSDFSAESCVAIHDPPQLWRRLARAIETHNASSANNKITRLHGSPVLYADPFRLVKPNDDMEVHFVKHFRYAYQAEYRFVLIPTTDQPLQPFFLEMGSIEDFASVVERA
jgi:hypothetical protein